MQGRVLSFAPLSFVPLVRTITALDFRAYDGNALLPSPPGSSYRGAGISPFWIISDITRIASAPPHR